MGNGDPGYEELREVRRQYQAETALLVRWIKLPADGPSTPEGGYWYRCGLLEGIEYTLEKLRVNIFAHYADGKTREVQNAKE